MNPARRPAASPETLGFPYQSRLPRLARTLWDMIQRELVDRLSELPWLDQVADTVSGLTNPILDSVTGLKDLLHGRWLGHALHPVVTDLPIGFWISSLLLDLVGAGKSAGLLSAAGSVSALGAVATGLADWTPTYGSERRLGMLHALLNTAGLTCQVVSLSARLRGRRLRAIAFSATGLSISSAAAYLGGELVMNNGVMVNHTAWESGPEDWTVVGASSDWAEGQTKPLEAGGRALLVSRFGGQFQAISATCSHAGGPLGKGEVKGGVVTCPWHGSQFRVDDGEVVRAPATFCQPRLQARVTEGQVQVKA